MSLQQPAPHRVHDAVTVHSMGGLGNQLFIYAAGMVAARAAGARLRVDVGQHLAGTDRPCILPQLGLPADYVNVGLRSSGAAPRFIERVSRSVWARDSIPHSCTFRESSFRYDSTAQMRAPGDCMHGFFQSWRYVDAVADELRGHCDRLMTALAPELHPLLRRLSNPGTIVLHVRRGDYLSDSAQGYHGLTGLAYYRNALRVLRQMGYDGSVYLFSDDVTMAVRELASLGDIQPLCDEPRSALDELLLMSRAPAIVTANSSFSWWAGLLGDRLSRPVIAPRPWFDDLKTDSRDLLPPHWLTLDRRAEPSSKRST